MTLHRIIFFSILFLSASLRGDAQEKGPSPRIRQHAAETKKLRAKLLKMNVADGINENEADTIARAYFIKYVGCGNYEKVSDAEDFWQIEGRWGLGAQPIKGFVINKVTGEIKSPIGPNYLHPKDIFAPPP
jgi:hypothetical protein